MIAAARRAVLPESLNALEGLRVRAAEEGPAKTSPDSVLPRLSAFGRTLPTCRGHVPPWRGVDFAPAAIFADAGNAAVTSHQDRIRGKQLRFSACGTGCSG